MSSLCIRPVNRQSGLVKITPNFFLISLKVFAQKVFFTLNVSEKPKISIGTNTKQLEFCGTFLNTKQYHRTPGKPTKCSVAIEIAINFRGASFSFLSQQFGLAVDYSQWRYMLH